MSKTLIAKPVVKNQFWIVTDGDEKVGNVLANGSGFEVKLNGNKTQYKNTKAIERITNIQFENVNKFNKFQFVQKLTAYGMHSSIPNFHVWLQEVFYKLSVFTSS